MNNKKHETNLYNNALCIFKLLLVIAFKSNGKPKNNFQDRRCKYSSSTTGMATEMEQMKKKEENITWVP